MHNFQNRQQLLMLQDKLISKMFLNDTNKSTVSKLFSLQTILRKKKQHSMNHILELIIANSIDPDKVVHNEHQWS